MKTKKRVRRSRKVVKFIATIITAGVDVSARNLGDWSSFVGNDRNEVVRRAIKARDKWTASGSYGPYEIYVGTLAEKIVVPVSFKVVAI